MISSISSLTEEYIRTLTISLLLLRSQPLFLLRMDTDIAPASLASGRAAPIGAEYGRGIHAMLLLVVRGSVPRGVCRGSGRQGRESCGVEVPTPSIARFGRLAYPMYGEVTNRNRLGRTSHGCPVP
jgi:hypothetical protein